MEEYVTAFRQQVRAANLLKTPISPFLRVSTAIGAAGKGASESDQKVSKLDFRYDIAETMTKRNSTRSALRQSMKGTTTMQTDPKQHPSSHNRPIEMETYR